MAFYLILLYHSPRPRTQRAGIVTQFEVFSCRHLPSRRWLADGWNVGEPLSLLTLGPTAPFPLLPTPVFFHGCHFCFWLWRVLLLGASSNTRFSETDEILFVHWRSADHGQTATISKILRERKTDERPSIHSEAHYFPRIFGGSRQKGWVAREKPHANFHLFHSWRALYPPQVVNVSTQARTHRANQRVLGASRSCVTHGNISPFSVPAPAEGTRRALTRRPEFIERLQVAG